MSNTTVSFQILSTQAPFSTPMVEKVINLSTNEVGILYMAHAGRVDWGVANQADWVISCYYTGSNSAFGAKGRDMKAEVSITNSGLLTATLNGELSDYNDLTHDDLDEEEEETNSHQDYETPEWIAFRDLVERRVRVLLNEGHTKRTIVRLLMADCPNRFIRWLGDIRNIVYLVST